MTKLPDKLSAANLLSHRAIKTGSGTGPAASEVMQVVQHFGEDVDEVQVAREMLFSVEDELKKAVEMGQKEFKGQPFYIECFFRKHEHMPQNHIKPKFIVEAVCPTPCHDHVVWKVHRSGEVEYLWNVPSYEICLEYLMYPNMVQSDEAQLMQMILDFSDGTLRQKAKKLNGEI